MLVDDQFKVLRHDEHGCAFRSRPDRAVLLALLQRDVVERFEQHSRLRVIVDTHGLDETDDDVDPPDNPGHPACAAYASSDYCRESWQLHMAELRTHPRTHWHRCAYGMNCAVVPVACRGRCLAAAKLVCPATAAGVAFVQEVDLLDTLVREFVGGAAEFLDRLVRAEHAVAARRVPAADRTAADVESPACHPLVTRALRYIEEHLADPGLSVARVAQALSVHANYLSHLFVEQLGRRMRRYIVDTRIARAKVLLATTEWQIKRVAAATGHANPSWFGHVFVACTGVSPCEYRGRVVRGRPLEPESVGAQPPVVQASIEEISDPLCFSQVEPVFAGNRAWSVA